MSQNFFGFTANGSQYSAAAAANFAAANSVSGNYLAPYSAGYSYAAPAYAAYATTKPNITSGYSVTSSTATIAAPAAYYPPAATLGSGAAGINTSPAVAMAAAVKAQQIPTVKPAIVSANQAYSGYDAALYAAATNFLHSKGVGGAGGVPGAANLVGGVSASAVSQLQLAGAQLQPRPIQSTNPGRPTPNYQQQQPQTGGSFQLRGGFRGGNNRQGFGYRGRGTGGFGGANRIQNQQVHYCDICKISCAGPMTYKEHLEGQKHKKKELQLKAGGPSQPLPRAKASFRCELCNVTCTGRDTYNTHIRGAKHLKTVKLHQALGKPIPDSENPTIINPAGNGAGAEGGDSGGAANLALLEEKEPTPVGEDYVESIKSDEGKLISYHCKLCDCKFNDIQAKDLHLKGRRHRFQYKKKVDPDLEVDMKYTPRNRREIERMRREMMIQHRQMRFGRPFMGSRPPMPLFSPMGFGSPPGESLDDVYVKLKHEQIYPSEEELVVVQRIVNNTEKALKGVSDYFSENPDESSTPVVKVEQLETSTTAPKVEPERVLKGVMRVGILAKGIMLKQELRVEIVVVCNRKPTMGLLYRVYEQLPKQFEIINCDDKYELKVSPENGCINITCAGEMKVVLVLRLTSAMMRDSAMEVDDTTTTTEINTPPDVLNKAKCLDALAALRRAKWFQAKCANLPSAVIVLRVMRDLCNRIPTWKVLNNYCMELLVEKVLNSAGVALSPGDAFRCIFEAISSGLLLPTGPGLVDPCEREIIDITAELTAQQREDITASAQHALRLIAFRQIWKVLEVEQLSDDEIAPLMAAQRKRPLDSSVENMETDEKKVKDAESEDTTTTTVQA